MCDRTYICCDSSLPLAANAANVKLYMKCKLCLSRVLQVVERSLGSQNTSIHRFTIHANHKSAMSVHSPANTSIKTKPRKIMQQFLLAFITWFYQCVPIPHNEQCQFSTFPSPVRSSIAFSKKKLVIDILNKNQSDFLKVAANIHVNASTASMSMSKTMSGTDYKTAWITGYRNAWRCENCRVISTGITVSIPGSTLQTVTDFTYFSIIFGIKNVGNKVTELSV